MADILYSHDKDIHKAKGFDGILAALWRTMLFDLKVRPELFNQLLDNFIKTRAAQLLPKQGAANLKGNWMKEFAKPQMTWRNIMKAILLLRVSKMKLTVELEYMDRPGMKTTHSVRADLTPYYDPNNVFDKIYEDERIETSVQKFDRVEQALSETVDKFGPDTSDEQ